MGRRIVAGVFITVVASSSLIFFPTALAIWMLTFPFDRRLVVLHLFTCFWASLYLWLMPAWIPSVKGREKIRKGTSYIMVSNHQSNLDILLVFRLFVPFKWVSKSTVFNIPLIGWNMALNRYVRVQRGGKEKSGETFRKCERLLADGNSIFFFPEGTRSETGLVSDFKLGAFLLAKKMKVPILPIAISGTGKALPKKSLNFHGKHQLGIKVLDEIPFASFSHLPVDELKEMVRSRIVNEVQGHKLEAR